MEIKSAECKLMLISACKILKKNADMFSKIDAQIGDGDHGITIHGIASIIEEAVERWHEGISLKTFFNDLGWKIMGVNGGSAGPLWGSLFQGFAKGLNEEDEVIDELVFKKMFIAGIEEMYEISSAKVGDKTMMDALIPAVEVIKNSDLCIADMLLKAYWAAKDGSENTANYIAKFGRSKYLKERSLGHKDPGAVSVALLLEGMSNALN